MASIHKDPRGKSPFWYCAYRLHSGKRVFKSTKLKDRKQAEEFCRGLERAVKESKEGSLTEFRARELISEIVKDATGARLVFHTTHAWLMAWLKENQLANANGTYLKYQHTIKSFLDALGPKAERNLNQITKEDIQQFRDAEFESGKHPSTCDSLVKHLRIPFNRAREQGLIQFNPAEGVKLLCSRKGNKKRSSKTSFTLEQIRALLEAAEGEWRGVILTCFYTGARLRDITTLRWESVDLERQLISFTQGKTGDDVVIPIHPELHAYLLELSAPDDADAFVFPKLASKKTSGKSGLSMAFARIMEKAHVRGKVVRKGEGKGRTINSLSAHSLRHSFNSILANAGIAQEIRQKLTGHASAEMNKRYTHHELEPLRAAISALPKV